MKLVPNTLGDEESMLKINTNHFGNAHNHHSSQIRGKLADLNKKNTSKYHHGV